MFDFKKAQEHELEWQRGYIETNLGPVYDAWFNGQENPILVTWLPGGEVRDEFEKHIKGKKAMEIGCGSVPHLRDSLDLDRVVIDPLAVEYRKIQEDLWGGSFFGGMDVLSHPAEEFNMDYLRSIDGVVICRNTLDHSEDPLSILWNISKYAALGCYFFFWTDLWHKKGVDDGHRNITKSFWVFERLIYALGFDFICGVKSQHDNDDFIEYGGVFKKRL